MRFKLLPHSFKYIGLILFLLGGLPLFLMGFIEGFSGKPEDFILTQYISPSLESIMEIAGSLGILIYFLARDKHYDELHEQMRAQVLTIVVTVSVVLITLIHLVSPSTSIDAYGLVVGQMSLFLIIRFLVKQADKSPEPV